MPSLIDLRRRVRAVKNTQQITKAMKMVAASKLRRAQERIMSARPYRRADAARAGERGGARRSVDRIRCSRSASGAPDSRTLVIVVTGDKGLCGSFNTNVIKGAGAFVAESPQPLLARPRRPQGPRLLRPPRLRRAVRADRHLPEAARSRTRRRSRRLRSSVHRRARSIAWCSSTTSSSR